MHIGSTYTIGASRNIRISPEVSYKGFKTNIAMMISSIPHAQDLLRILFEQNSRVVASMPSIEVTARYSVLYIIAL